MAKGKPIVPTPESKKQEKRFRLSRPMNGSCIMAAVYLVAIMSVAKPNK